MSEPRILVLGASTAGLKAAARARRLLPDASITVVDRREQVGHSPCGLAHVLAGEVDTVDDLRRTSYGVLRDARWYASARGIELLTDLEVLGIDRDTRAVSVRSTRDDSRTMLMYDQLVYALGSEPRVPDGVEPGRAVVSASAPGDVTALRRDLERGAVGSVLVLGAGWWAWRWPAPWPGPGTAR